MYAYWQGKLTFYKADEKCLTEYLLYFLLKV